MEAKDKADVQREVHPALSACRDEVRKMENRKQRGSLIDGVCKCRYWLRFNGHEPLEMGINNRIGAVKWENNWKPTSVGKLPQSAKGKDQDGLRLPKSKIVNKRSNTWICQTHHWDQCNLVYVLKAAKGERRSLLSGWMLREGRWILPSDVNIINKE